MRWRDVRFPDLGTWVKLAAAMAFEGAGRTRALGAAWRAGGPRVHILGFHRVVDDLDALAPQVIPALCITTRSFERLLDIARARFDVLPLEAAAAVVTGAARARRDVLAITFDDGYRDVYLRALPALRRRGLPATVFVPTGLIGSPEPLLHDRLHALLVRSASVGGSGRRLVAAAATSRLLRRSIERAAALVEARGPAAAVEALIEELPAAVLHRLAAGLSDLLGEGGHPDGGDEGARVMSEDELRACADGGIDLGAHTIGHVALVREPPARVRHELAQPRRVLEAIAGRPCRTFAYCNGLWTDLVRATVREAGYVAAVTTADRPNRPGDDPFLLGRKVLWEGHVRAGGRFSAALAAAQLHDLFGLFGSAAVHAGRREPGEPARAWGVA